MLINEDRSSTGCIMCALDPESAKRVHQAQNYIREDELTDDARELASHVTVRYGIEEATVAELYNKLSQIANGPIHLELEDLTFFETPKADAIHFRVKTDQILLDLRDEIEDICECLPDNHPDYIPHVTIAYVHKGMGAEICQRIKEGLEYPNHFDRNIICDEIVYSDKDNRNHHIPLVNSKELATEALLNLVERYNVSVHVEKGKISDYKAKQIGAKLEELGGKITKGKTGYNFKAPAKMAHTLIHKLWKTKGLRDQENGLTHKFTE